MLPSKERNKIFVLMILKSLEKYFILSFHWCGHLCLSCVYVFGGDTWTPHHFFFFFSDVCGCCSQRICQVRFAEAQIWSHLVLAQKRSVASDSLTSSALAVGVQGAPQSSLFPLPSSVPLIHSQPYSRAPSPTLPAACPACGSLPDTLCLCVFKSCMGFTSLLKCHHCQKAFLSWQEQNLCPSESGGTQSTCCLGRWHVLCVAGFWGHFSPLPFWFSCTSHQLCFPHRRPYLPRKGISSPYPA